VSVDRVSVELGSALAAADDEIRWAVTKLSEQMLWQLWVTAYAMGCVAGQTDGFVTGQGYSMKPTQRRLGENALATVAAGGLARALDEATAEGLSWQLRHLCRAGFTAGTTDPSVSMRPPSFSVPTTAGSLT